MSKTGKLVTSLIATQIIYGAYYLFSFKKIILPLPIIELITLFAILIALNLEQKNTSTTQKILLIVISIIELTKSQFLLRLVLTVPTFEKLSQSIYFDINHLLKSILISFLYYQWLINIKMNKIFTVLISALIGIIILSPNLNIFITNIVFYSSIFLLLRQYQKNPITNLWLIIVFEFMSTYWMTGVFIN